MPKKFYDIIPSKDKTRQKENPSVVFGKGVVFFLIFLVLAVGVFGLFFFAKIEIEIWPETENLNFKKTIIVDLNKKEADLVFSPEGGTIPGEIFTDQKFASEDFPALGKVLKEEKARGIIRVYNAYSDSPQPLLATTRFVSAEGKLFRTPKAVVIPGGHYEKGKLVPGEIDIEVVAAEPGEDYNIGPSTFSLPGLVGGTKYTVIYGKSFSPMTGGFRGEISRVSQEDLDRAKNILAERLKKESKEFLKISFPADFLLIEEAVIQEIIESKSSVEVLTEVGSFNFRVRVKSEGTGAKKSDIENFAKYCINLNTPEGKKLQEESLEINHSFGAVDRESGKITLNLEIKARVYTDINLNELKKALLGKSLKETKLFLDNLKGIERIEIKSWSFFSKKIPEKIDKVKLRLNIDPVK